MKNLRVCIAAPSHAYQYYGGGEVLLNKTAEYLNKEGVDFKFFDPWHDKVEDFDVVHFFGIGYFNILVAPSSIPYNPLVIILGLRRIEFV